MVARVLVLLVAVLLVAAPRSHVCAELTGDVAMASLDEAQPVTTVEASPVRHPAVTQPLRAEDSIAPAPARAGIFRPPRAAFAPASPVL